KSSRIAPGSGMNADGPHERPEMQLQRTHFIFPFYLPVVSGRAAAPFAPKHSLSRFLRSTALSRAPIKHWTALPEPGELLHSRATSRRQFLPCYTLLTHVHVRFPRGPHENFSVACRGSLPMSSVACRRRQCHPIVAPGRETAWVDRCAWSRHTLARGA